mmetsp:Transcript_20336/g.48364  ORF Transcript_20336/g.48364 Transcript_20336/m.48364 type:complete len:254 (-) Transcript_20336:821-1582(-)
MAFKLSKDQNMCGGAFILVFVVTAILLGFSGMFGCWTVKFPATGGGQLDAGLFRYRTKEYYYIQDDNTVYYSDTCVSYNLLSDNGFGYTLDKKAEAMQGLAIAIGTIGGVFAIISCIIPCIPGCPNKIWQATGLIFVIAGIMQGCTLMLLDSSLCTNNPFVQYLTDSAPVASDILLVDPTTCEKSRGYNLIISATVFWLLAGLMTCCFSAPTCFPDDDIVDDNQSDVPPAATGDGDAKDVEVPEETHKDDEEK